MIEKKPPAASMKEFVVTLESCIAHEGIADVDDNFLPEVLELTEGNKVHTVTLVAAICDKMASNKVICRSDPSSQLSQIDVHPTEPWKECQHVKLSGLQIDFVALSSLRASTGFV